MWTRDLLTNKLFAPVPGPALPPGLGPLRWHMMYTRNSENMQVLELREESVGGTVRHHLPRGQDQAARRLLRRADAFRSLTRS